MPLTPQTLRIAEQVRIELAHTLDAQTRALVGAWARGWDEIAAELSEAVTDLVLRAEEGRVTRAAAMRSSRLARALTVAAGALDELGRHAGVVITGDLAAVVEDAAGVQAQLTMSQLPLGITADLGRIDPAAIAAIVARTTRQVEKATRPLGPDAAAAMRRELVRGVVVGANPRTTAARMVARAQGRFEGGLSRALVIARTETLDAHRQAAQQAQAAQADMLIGWVWTASLGPRTCPACWALHGTVHDLAEPGPLDHHQGRCARVPKTKSWADLGFDADEPDDLLPDAETEFAALSPAQQRDILGPVGYEAWRRGEFPMGSWAQRRHHDGWRDSFVPAKPPRSLAAAS